MSFSLLKEIGQHFDIKDLEIIKLIRSAPLRYKVYKIPRKREGEFRIIAQPAKEVKILQYWIIDNILKNLPVHKSAMAYLPKKNIRENATIHVRNSFILKMDFENFFPSIKAIDFKNYMESLEKPVLIGEDINYAISILFWKPKGSDELVLSIGAPSSPILSNLIMLQFDHKVEELCDNYNVKYSRYADDLTFSTSQPKILNKIYQGIINICNDIKSPSLKINKRKTVFSSKKHRRRVTGLILTNDNNISLGRDRKRAIRVKIHQFLNGRLVAEEAIFLKGMIAFAMDNEPSFVDRMREKFGAETIQRILKYVTISNDTEI